MDHNPRSDLRALLRSGLSKSLVSLLIKVATAGLTYADVCDAVATDGGRRIRLFRLRAEPRDDPRHRRQFRPADGDPALLAGGNGRRPAATRRSTALRSGGAHHAHRERSWSSLGLVAVGAVAGVFDTGPVRASLRRRGADPAAGARRILELGAARAGLGVDRPQPARHHLAAGAAAAGRRRCCVAGVDAHRLGGAAADGGGPRPVAGAAIRPRPRPQLRDRRRHRGPARLLGASTAGPAARSFSARCSTARRSTSTSSSSACWSPRPPPASTSTPSAPPGC